MEYSNYNCNGKIWVFIQEHIQVEVLADSDQMLTLKLLFLENNQHLIVSIVYAKCEAEERLQLWNDIYCISNVIQNSPWLIGEDFNVIMSEEEKIGGLPIYPNEYEDFAFCVNSCDLVDISFKGSPFTLWNGRIDDQCIFKRLDRYTMNQAGLIYFGLVESKHLARTGSDHAPILLTCGQKTEVTRRPFRFLKFWSEHAEFQQIVKDNWVSEEADVFIRLKQKMKKTKTALSNWSRVTFGDIFKQLSIREEIVRVKEVLFETSPTTENRKILQKAQAELKMYVHFEEEYWRQKAGIQWFTEGEKNTRFFHSLVRGRRKRLSINRIQSKEGVWVEGEELVAVAAQEYFHKAIHRHSDYGGIPSIEIYSEKGY
ncbi:uncharacterized protein [Solanum tuberosum]|uniref:uncharacterized protein n=1 Tax=Solanum tuberosum TaxID=4113 RepID=UPI000739FEBE|nr:PREDICTED: uncharacterized protein LOC107059037 [Solanum tuberosum]KAH0702373.1 hypothetical protein KY285_016651 [Solanum tuberosum]